MKERKMTIDNAIRVLAGSFILASLTLGHYQHPYWYFLGVFVGINLIQSAFTGFCPAAMVFKKMGFRSA